MKLVSDLTSFILGAITAEDAGRVALYHYTKNFKHERDLVTPELINDFFAEALQLSYWQDKKIALYQDVMDLLAKFSTQFSIPFNLGQVWNLPTFQLVTVENPENLHSVVKFHETSLKQPNEELRIFQISKTQIVVIKRFSHGGMNVRTYNNLTRLVGNQLLPLNPEQELQYDSGLELLFHVPQRLKPAPHSSVQFVVAKDGITVKYVSGYAMRLSQHTMVTTLEEDPRLFFHLKRLEKFYVQRQSDPYYTELANGLDRAKYLIKSEGIGAYEFCKKAFENGQIAFDQIYPDDRHLYNSLRELARLLAPSMAREAKKDIDASR